MMEFLPCSPSPLCTSSILILLLLVGPYNKTEAILRLPANVSIPAVFVFGDSIMDTGNNNNNTETLARCNFRPYGEDLQGGIPTGRFSNGKVPSDFIAEALGIKEFLPAYMDPNLQPNELATGVCFASGGAGFDPLTSQLASAIPFSSQIEMFKECIGNLRRLVGEERTKSILANSLFLVVFGSNDISNTYFLSRIRQLQYDVPAYTDLLVNFVSDPLKEIYELGARRIGVFSAPPIGCVPFHRTVSGGTTRDCVKTYNDAVKLFNSKLLNHLDSLHRHLPHSRIIYIDVYNPLLDIILNPQSHGYGVGDRGCCGTGELEVALLCNRLDPTCPNVLDYVFWDSFHPTESVYRKLVDTVLQNYVKQFA